MKIFLVGLFVLGLVYILLPGPTSINDFPPLPNSVKSDLDGDTWQNPNLVAYFSDFQRKDITQFYKNFFSSSFLFGRIIPPIRLNRPPEEAYQYIRDQQESTFLEEYLYPLKGSIYVNGYEPLVENSMQNRVAIVGFVGNHIWFKENPYNSKTTLRYYPVRRSVSLLVYLGIWIAALALWKVFRRSLRDQ